MAKAFESLLPSTGFEGEESFYDFHLTPPSNDVCENLSTKKYKKNFSPCSWRTCCEETVEQGPSKAAKGIEEGEVYQ